MVYKIVDTDKKGSKEWDPRYWSHTYISDFNKNPYERNYKGDKLHWLRVKNFKRSEAKKQWKTHNYPIHKIPSYWEPQKRYLDCPSWGYCGSGSYSTSFYILWHFTKDFILSEMFCQYFLQNYVSTIPQDEKKWFVPFQYLTLLFDMREKILKEEKKKEFEFYLETWDRRWPKFDRKTKFEDFISTEWGYLQKIKDKKFGPYPAEKA